MIMAMMVMMMLTDRYIPWVMLKFVCTKEAFITDVLSPNGIWKTPTFQPSATAPISAGQMWMGGRWGGSTGQMFDLGGIR